MPSTNVGASSASNRLCAAAGASFDASAGTGKCNVACNDVGVGLCWSGTSTTTDSCSVSTDGQDGINSRSVLGDGILGDNDTGMASKASTFQKHTQVKVKIW